MKLLPFDLEKAKAGHKIVTREGKEGIFLSHDATPYEVRHRNIWVWIKDGTVYGQSRYYFSDGTFYNSDRSTLDLFLVDEFTDAQRYQFLREIIALPPEELEKYEAPFKKALLEVGHKLEDGAQIKPEFFDIAIDAVMRAKLEQSS
jgi:hypothetical protein